MSLPVSCPLPPESSGGGGGGPPCSGSPSPGGYTSSETSAAGGPPFCAEASGPNGPNSAGGSFVASSNGNNYSPFDPTNGGGYPVTSSAGQLQAHDRNHNHPLARVPGRCGRPGCPNPVNKAADGTESTYCSSECVVGQCREVYTSWATSGSALGSAAAGVPPAAAAAAGSGAGGGGGHHHLLAVPPPPQVK